MAMTRFERAVRLLPLPVKSLGKRARAAADPLFVAGYRARSRNREPIPPGALRARSGSPRLFSYMDGGRLAARDVAEGISRAGRSPDSVDDVLDFGCGSGRVIRHLPGHLPGARLHGSDVDADAIGWAQHNLPGIQFSVNPYRPPLPFEDDSFDLVYSISVFTHLNEQYQDDWLREIARVVRPGGLALLTVHGEYAFNEFKSGRYVSNTRSCSERVAVHGSIEDEGFVYEPYEITTWNGRDFPGIDDTFGLTFHSRDYVERHWGRTFEIQDVLPRHITGWQDLVLARKPA
jgi:SAM-dependent methyltransferase